MVDLQAPPEPFSDRLAAWLKSDDNKTVGQLGEVFGDKSFAVTVLLLMFLPALPIPTGGITHVFEVIVVILGLQMILGAKTIWLPAKLRHRELGESLTDKALPLIVKRIKWFEQRSKPRGVLLLENPLFVRLLGVVLIAFSLGAMFAPPFSGLDTLPALGAVLICLGIILDDLVILCVGAVIGTVGVTLMLTIGAAVVHFARGLFG